jgi:hypothetical protein
MFMIYCKNMKMYLQLMVNTVPSVGYPLVRVLSCHAVVGQEATL